MVYADLLKELNNDWIIDKKVVYLLYRVCQESMYDVRIDYLTDDINLLKKIYFGFKNIDIDEDDNRLVCNTAAHLLHDLLKREGINSRVVYNGDIEIDEDNCQLPGAELIYQDENGNYKFVNVVMNLFYCKLDLLPMYFGLGKDSIRKYKIDEPICELEDEELIRICTELGICKAISWKNFFCMLRDEIKSNNTFRSYLEENGNQSLSDFDVLERKIDFISKCIPCKIRNAGPSEVQQFYMHMLCRYVLNRDERKKDVKMMSYYKREGDEIDVIKVIQISDDQRKHKYYTYDKELRTFVKMKSIEQFLSTVNGYTLFDKEDESKKGKKRETKDTKMNGILDSH